MKKKHLILSICILSFTQPALPQLPKFLAPGGDAGYMGLFDMELASGFLHGYEHHTYPANSWVDRNTNAPFIMAHFQESILSNYFWRMDQDLRFKVGFTETLDLGASYQTIKETTDGPNVYPHPPTKGAGFIFTYEAGLGGVYKVNDKMDAGLTYYLFSLSTFNRDTDKHHYPKFRFRYSHIMTELSVMGKNAIDIKYLKGLKDGQGQKDRSMSSYIGFSYTGWKTESVPSGIWNTSKAYYYLSIGFIL